MTIRIAMLAAACICLTLPGSIPARAEATLTNKPEPSTKGTLHVPPASLQKPLVETKKPTPTRTPAQANMNCYTAQQKFVDECLAAEKDPTGKKELTIDAPKLRGIWRKAKVVEYLSATFLTLDCALRPTVAI